MYSGYRNKCPPVGRRPPLDEIFSQGGTGGLEIYRSEYIRYAQKYAEISTETKGKYTKNTKIQQKSNDSHKNTTKIK